MRKRRTAAKKRKRVPNPGGKPGRPMYEPSDFDRGLVQGLAGTAHVKVIAALVGISHETLRKHFAEQLTLGREFAFAKLLHKSFSLALAGNTTLLIYLMRCMGPEEFKQLRYIAPEGGDDSAEKDAVLSKLAPAEVERFREAVARATGLPA